jgi:glycine betaine/proline transport system substrate-binding protein
MTALEEPPYDEKVWETTKKCAFKSVQVNILVNATLPERVPDVVEMLEKYETTTALNNEIIAFMQDTKGKAEDGARWFLKHKEPLWTTWVPSDVAVKVKKALK